MKSNAPRDVLPLYVLCDVVGGGVERPHEWLGDHPDEAVNWLVFDIATSNIAFFSTAGCRCSVISQCIRAQVTITAFKFYSTNES